MDIKSLFQFAEEDAIQKGIDLKSPKTKEIIQIWTDHDVKEAIANGDYGNAFDLLEFNEWVQQY